MTETSATELSRQLQANSEDLIVLDIRHEEDYDQWHIPGSVNLDIYDELAENPDAAKEALAEWPAGAEIVTVCAAGVLSQTATEVLREMGYNATTLVDGMNGWSRVHRTASIPVGFEGSLIQVTRPGKGCLSHVLLSDELAAVFDPSQYIEEYETILDDHGADLVAVFDTHAHADHVSGGVELAERHSVPYYLHAADALAIDATPLEDEQTIPIGDVGITAVHTPGHSPGSVSFDLDSEALLTGDTLFHDSVGRVELGVSAGIEDADIEQNAATLYESLQRLLDRPDETLVLPAHDPGSPVPPVTARLREVKGQNMDLGRGRDEFIVALASDIPDHPPNFERVKRSNVGQEDVPDEELATLELGPNRCAASE